MKDIDFTECKFIKENLRFLFFKDFYKDRFFIKKEYEKLSTNGKIFYKWFLYSNIYTDLHQKDCMWDFLNGNIESEELSRLWRRYCANKNM